MAGGQRGRGKHAQVARFCTCVLCLLHAAKLLPCLAPLLWMPPPPTTWPRLPHCSPILPSAATAISPPPFLTAQPAPPRRVASVEELLLPDRSATSASENLDGGPVVARKAAAAQHTDGSAVGDSAVALQHAGRPPAHEGEATAVGTPSKHKQQGRFTSTLESIKVGGWLGWGLVQRLRQAAFASAGWLAGAGWQGWWQPTLHPGLTAGRCRAAFCARPAPCRCHSRWPIFTFLHFQRHAILPF